MFDWMYLRSANFLYIYDKSPNININEYLKKIF